MSGTPASVAIVGGGVGGISTAAGLRASGFTGTITMVEASELPYDRPPLSKGYLAGEQVAADILLQQPGWYDDQSVRLVGSTRVLAIRPGERALELSDGRLLRADHVVLATGGHAARPAVPGVDSPRVHVLRDHSHADALRDALVPGARLLVVGGGLIGAETASTAARLGVAVTLIDPDPLPLAAALGPEMAEWLHRMHEARGVTTLCRSLTGLTDTGTEVLASYAGVAAPQPFDAVLVGVGLVPEVSLAQAIGLEIDQGVVVDKGQQTSHPGILAVGDPTRRRIDGVLRRRAEHWEAAQRDGERAAATILGIEPPAESAPWFWTDRHGAHVEAVGHMTSATSRIVRGGVGESSFSVWGLREEEVVAVAAVDDSTAVRAGRRMIDRHTPVRAAELADPGRDLRRLLRAVRH